MRTMADSIDANKLPTNVDFVAGYVNGKWQSYYHLPPGPRHISIAVTKHASALVFDYEKGDLLAEDYPDAIREYPNHTAYSSRSMWTEIKKVAQLYKLPLAPWWAAVPGYNGLYPGSIATQYTTINGDYDLSYVADYWPGIDPLPTDGETEMKVVRDNKTGRCYLLANGHLYWIPDATPDLQNAEKQFGTMYSYTPDFIKQFPGYIS